MRVAIIGGAGRVGLPLAAVLADAGHVVRAIDSDVDRVRLVHEGKSPFLEPGLDSLIATGLATGRLSLHTNLSATADTDVVFVVVGTDLNERNEPQNESVLHVVMQLLDHIQTTTTVVLRSTVLPGTTASVARLLHGRVAEVAFCPERIAEGRALEELRGMPQLVGTETGMTSACLAELFRSLGVESVPMTWKEAELGKLILNSWRYSQFAIANEFRRICELHEVSFRNVRQAILHQYPRGQGLMGPGFAGGPCLKKDTLQLLAGGTVDSGLFQSVLDSHRQMISEVVDEVIKNMKSPSSTVVQLGLTFKPGSDDLRSSVAVELASELVKRCVNFVVVDPYVSHHEEFSMASLPDAIAKADVVVIGTRHPEFVGAKLTVPCVDIGGFRLLNEGGQVE